MKTLLIIFLTAILCFASAILSADAQTDSVSEKLSLNPVSAAEPGIEVNVYLLKTGENYDAQFPSGLWAVKRKVDARSPLRAALEVLIEGATAEETRNDLASSTFGIKLVSVKIKNRTAYANFTQPEGAAFPGENAPVIFREAVEKTARQFRGVKKVVVCLDGILDFWSESDTPRKKCR